jgi:Fe-S-cluster containining protein
MAKTRISEVIATREVVDRFRELFNCRRCGACCTIFEGVKLKKEELEQLPVPRFQRLDVFELHDGTYYMKEPCRFYDVSVGCSIYKERPETCRNFPLHNERCEDGHVHLGVAEACPAALEAMAEIEVEEMGR